MSPHVICHAHCPTTGGGRLGLALLAAAVVAAGAALAPHLAGVLAVLHLLGVLLGVIAAAGLVGVLALFAWAITTRRRDDATEQRIRTQLGLPPAHLPTPPAPRRSRPPRARLDPTEPPPPVRVTATVLPHRTRGDLR